MGSQHSGQGKYCRVRVTCWLCDAMCRQCEGQWRRGRSTVAGTAVEEAGAATPSSSDSVCQEGKRNSRDSYDRITGGSACVPLRILHPGQSLLYPPMLCHRPTVVTTMCDIKYVSVIVKLLYDLISNSLGYFKVAVKLELLHILSVLPAPFSL